MVPFLTGHMWLIRVRPHSAPDTPKMTAAPRELLYVIYVFREKNKEMRSETETRKIKTEVENLDHNSRGRYVESCSWWPSL